MGARLPREQFTEGTTIEIPRPLNSFTIDSFKKYILVSEDLKEFVDSGFRTPEEIRHKKSITVAVVALITSILLGLWGIFRDIVFTCT